MKDMTRATFLKLTGAAIALTVLISVVMVNINWMGMDGSVEKGPIITLLNVMIVLSSFVFAIVLVMLGYCVWKYRAKPGDESDGEPIHGNTKLEIVWTVIPTVIVLFAAVYSWIVLSDIESKASDAMRVNVTAQQFKWTFNYPLPNGKVASSNELVVPNERQLDLHLTALDVVHSFWVPEWRIKKDGVPGITTTAIVTPDRLGTYQLICTELCGFGHTSMRATVIVEKPADFLKWVDGVKEHVPQPYKESILRDTETNPIPEGAGGA